MKNQSIECISQSRLLASYGIILKFEGMNIFAIDEIVDTMRNAGPHRLDHHVIVIILSGNAVLRLDHIDHAIKKNDLLFIAPNTIRETIQLDQATKGLFVSFTDDFLSRQGIYQSNIYPFDSSSPRCS